MKKSLLRTGQLGWLTLIGSVATALFGGSCNYSGIHDQTPNTDTYFNVHGGAAFLWISASYFFAFLLAETVLRLGLFRPPTHQKFEAPALVTSILATLGILLVYTASPTFPPFSPYLVIHCGLAFAALLVCSPKPDPKEEPS